MSSPSAVSNGARWTALGLGPPRAAWLRRVTEWSVSGAIRLDFIKCVSVEEVTGRLAVVSNPGSQEGDPLPLGLIIDASLLQRHTELIDAVRAARAVLIMVGAATDAADSPPVEATPGAICLSPDFGHRELTEALQASVQQNPVQQVSGQHRDAPTKPQTSDRQIFEHTSSTRSQGTGFQRPDSQRSGSQGFGPQGTTSQGPGPASARRDHTASDYHTVADNHTFATNHTASDNHAAGADHSANNDGHLVAVLGRPGSGTSTTAIALAQGFADMLGTGAVLLADLSRYGDQALLHDSPDVVPGIQELVSEYTSTYGSAGAGSSQTETLQSATTGTKIGAATDSLADEAPGVRHLAYEVAERGYDLLLGMRRRRDWTSLRLKPLQEAITTMRHDYRMVITDLDDDLEGKSETGSADIETRNLAARHVAQVADAVLVIGTASLVGVRSMLQLIDDLHSLGVAPHRIRPLITRLRSRSGARQHPHSVSRLLSHNSHLGKAAHSPELRHVDDAHRNGTRLPNQLITPALTAVDGLLGTLEINSRSLALRQTA